MPARRTPLPVQYINPEGLLAPAGKYSHVAVADAGKFAFIAGQVALASDGTIVGKGDAGVQFRQAFHNMDAVLNGIGASAKGVVSLTTYLVGSDSVEQWRVERDAVYKEYYPNGHYPPNTLLVISGLARPEFKVEVSAVARIPD